MAYNWYFYNLEHDNYSSREPCELAQSRFETRLKARKNFKGWSLGHLFQADQGPRYCNIRRKQIRLRWSSLKTIYRIEIYKECCI